MYLNKVVKYLVILESLIFLLCSICFDGADIVIGECEKVLLIFKAYGYYQSHKVGMNVLIGLCYSLLRCPIIPLCGFCFFAAIADISFSVISKDNTMVGKMFL